MLGSFTIGDNCNIGSNAVVLRPVPPNSTVVGNPGKVVKQNGERVRDRLDHTNLPDPIVDTLRSMQKEIDQLRAELDESKEAGIKRWFPRLSCLRPRKNRRTPFNLGCLRRCIA